jgi:hypothetical protein
MVLESRSILRGISITAIAALLLSTTASAVESQDSASDRWQHHMEVGFDAAVLRPLGLIALVVGGTFVLPIAVITWPSGSGTMESAIERFVTTPADDLFHRPLGEF